MPRRRCSLVDMEYGHAGPWDGESDVSAAVDRAAADGLTVGRVVPLDRALARDASEIDRHAPGRSEYQVLAPHHRQTVATGRQLAVRNSVRQIHPQGVGPRSAHVVPDLLPDRIGL